MPTVPTAADLGLGNQQTRPNPSTPGVHRDYIDGSLPSGAFGAAAARANEEQGVVIQRAGEQIVAGSQGFADIALKMKEQVDKTKALDAFTLGTGKTRDALYSDGGLLTQQGSKALGIYDQFTDLANGLGAKISDGLSNESQRRIFSDLWRSHVEGMSDTVSRYQASEFQKYKDETIQATVEGAQKDAVNSFNNPTGVMSSLQTGEQAIRLNTHSLPENVIDGQVRDFRSAVHKGVIQRMVADDPMKAQAYYDAAKDDISGADHTVIEAWLREGSVRQVSAIKADSILQLAPSEKDALAAANGIKDATVRDAVVQRVRDHFVDERRLKDEAEKTDGKSAWGVISAGGNMDAIPPDLAVRLHDSQPQTLIAMQDYVTQRAKGQGEVIDYEAYIALKQLAVTNPKDFAALNLWPFMPLLGSKRDDIINLQADVMKNVTSPRIGQVATEEETIGRVADQLGFISSAPKGSNDSRRYAAFREAVDRAAAGVQQEKGEPLTTAETYDIAARVGQDMISHGVVPSESRSLALSNVGTVDEAVKNAAQAAGIDTTPGTDATVAKSYALYRDAVTVKIIAQQHSLNREVTVEEARQIAADLAQNVQVGGLIFNHTKRAYELTDDDKANIVVPADIRKRILAEWQKKNPNVGIADDMIRTLYLKYLFHAE